MKKTGPVSTPTSTKRAIPMDVQLDLLDRELTLAHLHRFIAALEEFSREATALLEWLEEK